MPSSKPIIVPEERLLEGYEYTIENAIRLLNAASILSDEYPDKALALAQIGQEEIGKSLTMLAAFHLSACPNEWDWFWKGWKSHTLKAHRAYFYEIIHPLRIILKNPNGEEYSGLPLRQPISKEKESGLYVDFDSVSKQFIEPVNEVSSFEASARISTLLYLSCIADAVRRALFHTDVLFRMKEFSAIAFKICSEMVYQKEMPHIIEQFKSLSKKHSQIVKDLQKALKSINDMIEQTTGKKISYT